MRIRLLLLFICLFVTDLAASVTIAAPKIIVAQKDKSILQEKLDKFSKERELSVGELMLRIGLDFRGTPYTAKTLDLDLEENLVINLREFDCTTFVENCLAIALTVKSGQLTFETFCAELEKIRYRNGQMNGYTSRLHYFSEWITDNTSKGLVSDVTAKLGGVKHQVLLNFMGTHPNSYPQLRENPEWIIKIKQIEKRVSENQYYFIPRDKIAEHEPELADGDIIALTTRIPGLDVSHVGLIYRKTGNIFLLNASSIDGKVELTRLPLTEYLKGSKSVTGIFVVRSK